MADMIKGHMLPGYRLGTMEITFSRAQARKQVDEIADTTRKEFESIN